MQKHDELELGIPVTLKTPDHFLLCKESLTRIGVANARDKKLYQSCHILHRRGEYSIIHFKRLYALDGKHSTLSEEDILREALVAKLLQDWNLLTVTYKEDIKEVANLNSIKIIPHKEKKDWELIQKYQLGGSTK